MNDKKWPEDNRELDKKITKDYDTRVLATILKRSYNQLIALIEKWERGEGV